MPRPSIDQLAQLSDFVHLNHYELEFVTFPQAVAGPPSSEELWLRCYSSDIPKATNQKQTVSLYGHQIHVPGDNQPGGSISLVFFETVELPISRFLKQWREVASEVKTQKKQPVAEVKCQINTYLLNRQNSRIMRFSLFGCFLEDYDPLGGGFTGDQGASLAQPNMTLSYDWFEDVIL